MDPVVAVATVTTWGATAGLGAFERSRWKTTSAISTSATMTSTMRPLCGRFAWRAGASLMTRSRKSRGTRRPPCMDGLANCCRRASYELPGWVSPRAATGIQTISSRVYPSVELIFTAWRRQWFRFVTHDGAARSALRVVTDWSGLELRQARQPAAACRSIPVAATSKVTHRKCSYPCGQVLAKRPNCLSAERFLLFGRQRAHSCGEASSDTGTP